MKRTLALISPRIEDLWAKEQLIGELYIGLNYEVIYSVTPAIIDDVTNMVLVPSGFVMEVLVFTSKEELAEFAQFRNDNNL